MSTIPSASHLSISFNNREQFARSLRGLRGRRLELDSTAHGCFTGTLLDVEGAVARFTVERSIDLSTGTIDVQVLQ